MARWEPNARERLEEAALKLFEEKGFDAITVEQIAARAGLTERTFFRYFADKKEVLFSGSDELAQFVADSIEAAPAKLSAIEVIGAGLEAILPHFPTDRAKVRARRQLIAGSLELREREISKMTAMATAATGALQKRGVDPLAARLAAEAGITVFKVAYEAFLEDKKRRELVVHVREALEQLKAVMRGRA
ncbi:MAG: TetR family transcriptional regulator [Myxococcaceae bacterium]